uniref:Uncharacterized protein n=1 Tax=Chromera velia CCMP2878 TaxID=1169474 RepID=A0A0G4FA13_9ALVE|eukprot:Cvel_3010.t1-p1 / transcript=Cvel_3010.t1 / gene=Cvel_3010 / organism=Chromera_velia_CCMP2878 / gene_product=hypothetical protein / transcript_product=hypothetical protein / location=Cvel_scaffold120:21112-21342(-) / protein_length=77 / sequence_SO=supercontig / SO=protein_coding / is_pseudo=false
MLRFGGERSALPWSACPPSRSFCLRKPHCWEKEEADLILRVSKGVDDLVHLSWHPPNNVGVEGEVRPYQVEIGSPLG